MFTTVKELRQHLRRILERVQAGEQVIVTKRGRPIAIISPFAEVEELKLKPFEEAWREIEEALEQSEPAFDSWEEALAASRGRLR